MISTNDDDLFGFIKQLLSYGVKSKEHVEFVGYNSRLDTVQAGILLRKLHYIDEFNQQRQKLAHIYSQALTAIPKIQVPWCLDKAKHVYHQYTIKVLHNQRDSMLEHLQKQRIKSAIYYPFPLHKMKVFQNNNTIITNLSISEQLSNEVLSLPIGPFLSENELIKIINFLYQNIDLKKKLSRVD